MLPASAFLVLRRFAPELILLFTMLLVLLGDLLLRQRAARCCTRLTLGGLLLAAVVAIMLRDAGATPLPLPAGLSDDAFALAVKLLGFLFVGIAALLAEEELCCRTETTALYCTFLLVAAVVISILGAASDLVLILLALDFLSIIAYMLTGYVRYDPRGTEAALKYFLYGGALTGLMLFGFSWLYGAAGTTNLAELGAFLDRGLSASALELRLAELKYVVLPALVMAGAGFAFKLSAAPFHQWAPDAYAGAPTASAAFISVAPKLAGFAVLVRFTLTALPAMLSEHGGDWQALLVAFALTTMIAGNLGALRQLEVKRLMAYSGVAQVGYMLIGVVTQSPAGLIALLFYLLAYGLANLGIFAGLIAVTGDSNPPSTEISAFEGLHKRAPGVAFGVLFGLLSLIGLPTTAGFIGKLGLFAAAIQGGFPWLAVWGVLNSVISAAYYWKLIRAMYFLPPRAPQALRMPVLLAAALGGTIALVALLGLFPTGLLTLLQGAVADFALP